MTGDAPPPGERPRWSFTWLIRLQRIGRRPRQEGEGGPMTHWSFWALIAIVGLEAIALVLLGVIDVTP